MSESKIEGSDDLFPALGNMSEVTIKHLREVIDRGDPVMLESYEGLVEDFIKTFNHAVLQSVPPAWALFGFTQALAVTLGACLRAGFSPKEGGKLIGIIVKNADISARMVQEVTKTN